MHHIKHAGVAPWTVVHLQEPNTQLQDSNIEFTELGITQAIPTKQNKKAHKSEDVGQCSNTWLTVSPADLDK